MNKCECCQKPLKAKYCSYACFAAAKIKAGSWGKGKGEDFPADVAKRHRAGIKEAISLDKGKQPEL